MSTPFYYHILYDTTTNDVVKFTADIDTALDKVESYNFNIKVCDAKWKQATQIAANLTGTANPTIPRANIDMQDIAIERSKLENERQIVLSSVDQAIRCLAEQREIGNKLAAQFESEAHELHQDALIVVAKWDTEITYLQLRREVVGHTV